MTSPLDTASSLLLWSNVLYVVGALLTLGTSALVLFEKRQIGKGVDIKHSVRNEVFFVSSAVICLAGTCGAIYFGNSVSDIKDADLTRYKITADGKIADANRDAAEANKESKEAGITADTARGKAEEARKSAEVARQKAEAIHAKAEEARQNSLNAEAEAEKAVLDKEKILHDNLELQKQVEDEKTARLQLEQSLAPRNLSKVAQDILIQQLRTMSPQDIDLVVYAGNPESENVAKQIAFAFQAVAWKPYFYTPMGGSVQGVLIEYDPADTQAPKVASFITLALQNSARS